MEFISDLHLHSRFSRACSKSITLNNLERYARIKGLNLLSTSDFQHPKWNKEIKENLKEDDKGILRSKTKFPFLWQTEISLIYTQDGKGRRVHHVILAPSSGVVDQIIEALGKKGRMDYDGRPIFGFDSVELVDMMRKISTDIEIIPAHAWTSHFSILGEYSQFSKVEDCFKDNTKYIHALETGMSSNPSDNWRLSVLDKFQLVSFSDSHSYWPWRLGREATVFDFGELSYDNVLKAIRTGEGLKSTVETPVFYGKYHFSGHRNCSFSCDPVESKKLNRICPKCSKKMTVGVADRIELLSDRPEGYKRENAVPFYSLLPLHELIAAVNGIVGLGSIKVWDIYNRLVTKFGNEFNVLLKASKEDLLKVVDVKLVNIILKNREGNLKIECGFDGVYGRIILDEKDKVISQKNLTSFA